MRPGHRYPDPAVAGTPSSGADQDVLLSFLEKLVVYVIYLIGHLHGSGLVESFRINKDHIMNIFNDPVAHFLFGIKQNFGRVDLIHIHMIVGDISDQRLNLKQVK